MNQSNKTPIIVIVILVIISILLGFMDAYAIDTSEDIIMVDDSDLEILELDDAPDPETTADLTPDTSPEPTPEETEEPEPTEEPEQTPNPYEVELLTHLGTIEGILIFFSVVILCYFVYRFLRLFI